MITDDSSLLICAVAQARHPSLKARESRRIDLVDADRRAKTALIFSHLMLPRFCWPRLLAAIIVSLSAVFGHDGAVSRQVPNLQPPAAVAATQPQAGSPLTISQAVESRPFDDPKFPDRIRRCGRALFPAHGRCERNRLFCNRRRRHSLLDVFQRIWRRRSVWISGLATLHIRRTCDAGLSKIHISVGRCERQG